MNWRNLVIGAILTLIVTIVGGVLVVLLTRQPTSAERIIYTVDEPVKFEANETKVSLVSAKVANVAIRPQVTWSWLWKLMIKLL